MPLQFRDDTPYSEKFEDIYFNPTAGLAETNHVFIDANQLPKRLRTPENFCIGELGFGTGLNFLATLQCWQNVPHPKATLHYFSIEKFPISLAELKTCHRLFPELTETAKLLQQQYPPLNEGRYVLELIPKQVYLHLAFGDVQTCLLECPNTMDAWFLDGFAPSKNPEMWTESVLKEIAKHSHLGTTLSTFSAAGQVKRDLEASGFKVYKQKGFGQKREMITAEYHQKVQPISNPWFSIPSTSTTGTGAVAIMGGGLAGLMTAYQLQTAGFEVQLFEQATALPNLQASNPAMILKPYLSPNLNFFDQYYTAGFLGMRQFILNNTPNAVIAKGMQEIPTTKQQQLKQQQLLKKRDIPSGFLDLTLVVDPTKLSNFLIQQLKPHIQLQTAQDPFSLRENFQAVIIATGQFAEWGTPKPGQVTILPETQASKNQPPLSYQGYCIPDGRGNRVLGSSFRHDQLLDVRASEHQQNLNYLAAAAPELAKLFADQLKNAEAFVGMRYTTPDHLPVIGGLPVQAEWLRAYDRLRYGDQRPIYPNCPYHNGIYLNLAHGSKGLSSSWMASTILTALLKGQPLPISKSLYQALHPARFWLRKLKCANSV